MSAARFQKVVVGAALCGLGLLVAGCEGGLHRKGETRFTAMGSYGEPIKGDVIWPDGKGRGQNAGLTLGLDHHLADRTAIVATLTPYRIYNQSDGDIYAGEFQLGLRCWLVEFDVFGQPVGIFTEALGGVTYGARSIPEEGSNFNFTQDTGLGVELPLTDDISWISGYRLKHLSNGRLFNDDNPSQNDHFVYTGLSIRLGG